MGSSPAAAPADDPQLLRRARKGDELAYRALVEPHRRELHAHCYRMLGSTHDAEDALQDALLRAWRGLPHFDGRSSVRSWLYKIATNTSLDAIARRKRRLLPADHGPPADPAKGVGQPLVESVWIEPYPDEALGVHDGPLHPEARFEEREGVELAFIAALQHLPPNQRAALILKEVLGFSSAEVAEMLETTTASVNSALQRARKTVDEKLPERTQQATLRSLDDAELRATVTTYVEAMGAGDVDRVVSLLTEDAAWSMPPLATWFRGASDVAEFLRRGPLSGSFEWRRRVTRANGQVAVAAYTRVPGGDEFHPFALDVLSFRGGRISEVCAFIARDTRHEANEDYRLYPDQTPDERLVEAFFTSFGLPERLPA